MTIHFIMRDVSLKWRNYRRYLPLIKAGVIQNVLHNLSASSCSVILIDQEKMHQLNHTYRNKNQPTDVLTFVDDQEEGYLGDIFINVDAIVQQAKDYNHSLKREFCFLVTHGVLHLLGYDHLESQQAQEMFQLQDQILDEIVKR